MKPGDLVKGKPYNPRFSVVKGKPYDPRFSGATITPMIGVIIKESKRTNYWGDTLHRWWWILVENGQMIEEVENYIEEA